MMICLSSLSNIDLSNLLNVAHVFSGIQNQSYRLIVNICHADSYATSKYYADMLKSNQYLCLIKISACERHLNINHNYEILRIIQRVDSVTLIDKKAILFRLSHRRSPVCRRANRASKIIYQNPQAILL